MDPIELQQAIEAYMAQNPGITKEQAMASLQTDRQSDLGLVQGAGLNTAPQGLASDPLLQNPIGQPGTTAFDGLSGVSDGYTPTEQDREFERLLDSGVPTAEANAQAYGSGELSTAPVESEANGSGLGSNIPNIHTGGFDLDSKAAFIGNFAGQKKGTKGRGLGLAASIGSFGLGAARTITSQIGVQKANQAAEDYARDKMKEERRFTPAPQSRDANYTGGNLYPDGGTHRDLSHLKEYFPDGGTSGGPTDAEVAAYKRKDLALDSDHSIAHPESFSLVADQTGIDEYLNKYPSQRKLIQSGARVWYDKDKDFYVTGESGDENFAEKFYSTAPAEAPAPRDPVMRDANTGKALPGRQVDNGQSIDRQYSQYLEQAANSPERLAKKATVNDERSKNKELLNSMSEEQKAAARKAGQTPYNYLVSTGQLEEGEDFSKLFQR